MRPIRFGLPVTPLYAKGLDGPIPTHSLVGYKYLERLLTIEELVVRPMPFMGMPYGLLENDPDWSKLSHAFTDDRLLGSDFINVVCGFGSIFQPSLTIDVYNVAITVVWPRPPKPLECESLSKYDWICCPNVNDVETLRGLSLPAIHLPINEGRLRSFFAEGYLTKDKGYVTHE